ncbi:hypothetical protein [Sphingopyxis sp. BSNA05]|uniref:hypothetical protein n=1 Tax=Sphingopyxis sp. BSNA05 TaxID=1236614 RepID=UPI001562F933|nr:hypothetical protein [Sphingopyxis sp. BSNA05]
MGRLEPFPFNSTRKTGIFAGFSNNIGKLRESKRRDRPKENPPQSGGLSFFRFAALIKRFAAQQPVWSGG